MKINIYQGSNPPSEKADITIVIDVLRAFTVAHYAFMRGAKSIFLAGTVEEAFSFKKKNPTYLLAGEINGVAIENFDLDNSPYKIQRKNLNDATLVQKTTNGVRATLNHMESGNVFVTGFSNARNTAEYVKELCNSKGEEQVVHIVASHPDGDDDLACAEYIRKILEGLPISSISVAQRIKESDVARKFFDRERKAFLKEDVFICMREIKSDFVMKVIKTRNLPKIERVHI